MNRRDFLKLGGAVLLALLVQTSPLGRSLGFSSAAAAGNRFRGTSDGKIFTSSDGGKTWSLMTDFGSAYSIRRVGRDSPGQVKAQLRYDGRSIFLRLMDDGKSWWTA